MADIGPMEGLGEQEVVRALALTPHPEGGFYRETFRDECTDGGGRALSTAIYYLLGAGDLSAWHRIDATEVWHWYAGAPLVLTVSPNGHDASAHHLGPVLSAGQRPQFVVRPHCWQTAVSLGAWTLVGCTVSPGFIFDAFELAPPDWRPTPRPTG
ncbi:cupin domain-containing protein [Chelatococcus reniformis]|uniref:Cupin n=1 Tax=Chelatococcus reniformis TaxID=1494448 RepID=A0A916X6T0_9HYPH|nr:cupin domain-containing protein [Chelatococcus reniformis]GGC46423.1 cupin [Chelatococcus reniformis]